MSLNIDNLTNGQLYFIYVRASYGSLGTASASAAFTGMPVAAPATPSITASSGWDGVLEVVWDKPQYAASYKVYWYKAGNTDAPHKDAKVSTVTGERTLITGVDNATSYRVWVQALNTAGESGYAFADVSATAVTAAPFSPRQHKTPQGDATVIVYRAFVKPPLATSLPTAPLGMCVINTPARRSTLCS